MGPASRCIGPLVLPPQPFQHPLPPTPPLLANFGAVKTAIKTVSERWPPLGPSHRTPRAGQQGPLHALPQHSNAYGI